MPSRPGAVLVLEDGKTFRGQPFGRTGVTLGEVVFCTGMTGYQETLTDPSYNGQIVVQTAPHIGNTGWNDEDDESAAIQVAGYVVRDPARTASSWRARRGLAEQLERSGVVGISAVDTRSLTRHIREHGVMRAGVFSGGAVSGLAAMRARVLGSPRMSGASLADRVGTPRSHLVPTDGTVRFRVAVLDLGVKRNTLRLLAGLGAESHVLPLSSSLDELLAVWPDGVFLSNGPGDPAAMTSVVDLTKAVLSRRIPLFGICFGNQILGRALGRGTYKMHYGHRGMNIPVIDRATGRAVITAQNHGFAVQGEPREQFDSPFGPVMVSQHCPNDQTVEGLRCVDVPAFSVQYHPEAAAGPHDTRALFDDFATLMSGSGLCPGAMTSGTCW